MPHSIPTDFEHLNLIEPLRRALQDEGYRRPTPIQARAIPHVLAGRDLLGCAQTGTGKTAAFALPILQLLSLPAKPPATAAEGPSAGAAPARRPARHARPIRCLVLSPTRELAAQIGASMEAYGRHTHLRNTVIFGGVGQGSQATALHRGVDIVVATPGRLCDLMGQGIVDLSAVEILVLDEADRMLDMGFLPDVRRIEQACPRKRQTLFFSATLTPQVERVAWSFITDPIRIEVTPNATTVDAIEQKLYRVERNDKSDLLVHVLRDPAVDRAIVFTRTKHGADKVTRNLDRAGVRSQAIHGNKSQGQRERALEDFRAGRVRVLVATDIAARGLDIDNVTHVINFDMPVEPEAYVHRIGRTGRAEAAGTAISFCTPAEREELYAIEKLIRIEIPLTRAEDVLRGKRSPAAHPADAHPPARREHPRHDSHPRAAPAAGHRAPRDRHDSRSSHDSHSRPDRRDARDSRDHRAPHDSRDSRAPRDHRAPRDTHDSRDSRAPRHDDRGSDHPPRREAPAYGLDHDPQGPRRPADSHREPRATHTHRDTRDPRDDRSPRDAHPHRAPHDHRAPRDSRDSRHTRDDHAPRDRQDRPAAHDTRDSRAPRDHRDAPVDRNRPRDFDDDAERTRAANERRFHGGSRGSANSRGRRGGR